MIHLTQITGIMPPIERRSFGMWLRGLQATLGLPRRTDGGNGHAARPRPTSTRNTRLQTGRDRSTLPTMADRPASRDVCRARVASFWSSHHPSRGVVCRKPSELHSDAVWILRPRHNPSNG
jgi:hypothetical protein